MREKEKKRTRIFCHHSPRSLLKWSQLKSVTRLWLYARSINSLLKINHIKFPPNVYQTKRIQDRKKNRSVQFRLEQMRIIEIHSVRIRLCVFVFHFNVLWICSFMFCIWFEWIRLMWLQWAAQCCETALVQRSSPSIRNRFVVQTSVAEMNTQFNNKQSHNVLSLLWHLLFFFTSFCKTHTLTNSMVSALNLFTVWIALYFLVEHKNESKIKSFSAMCKTGDFIHNWDKSAKNQWLYKWFDWATGKCRIGCNGRKNENSVVTRNKKKKKTTVLCAYTDEPK